MHSQQKSRFVRQAREFRAADQIYHTHVALHPRQFLMNAESALTTGTVLIVDDTPGNLAVLSDMLSESGYRVLVATDGHSALEQIKHLKPDIILLDILMPGIDGFETCRKLKECPSTQNIPVIFMTGLSELDDLLKGFDQGAVDYIVKPIRPAEVLARVEAQLTQTRYSQRAEQTLNHINFSALSFTNTGKITWVSSPASKILYDCFAEIQTSNPPNKPGKYLPSPLLKTISAQLKTSASATDKPLNSLQLSNGFIGKIVPCHHSDENMLLIEKKSQEWDLATMKSSFGLTVREAEILMWVSRGKTNKEIGVILETSPRTVNKHLEHVFEKLDVATRTAAVAKVLKKDNFKR